MTAAEERRIEHKADWRLALVLGLLLVAVLSFWWWTLSDYRAMNRDIGVLSARIDVFQKHVDETERVLAAVRQLELEVYQARGEIDSRIDAAERLVGDDRFDALERLLNEDRVRRSAACAPGSTNGAGKGAGGSE